MADDDEEREGNVLWTTLVVALWVLAAVLALVLLRLSFFS
jgi:hypothetical protein